MFKRKGVVIFSDDQSDIAPNEEDIDALFQGTLTNNQGFDKLLQHPIKVLQKEPSFDQIPINAMHIMIHNQRATNFPIRVAGVDATILCDMGTNISYMSYACHMKLKDPQPLHNLSALSVHSATGQNLCPIDLTHYNLMLGNTQFMSIFIVCKNSQKEPIIGLNMQ